MKEAFAVTFDDTEVTVMDDGTTVSISDFIETGTELTVKAVTDATTGQVLQILANGTIINVVEQNTATHNVEAAVEFTVAYVDVYAVTANLDGDIRRQHCPDRMDTC